MQITKDRRHASGPVSQRLPTPYPYIGAGSLMRSGSISYSVWTIWSKISCVQTLGEASARIGSAAAQVKIVGFGWIWSQISVDLYAIRLPSYAYTFEPHDSSFIFQSIRTRLSMRPPQRRSHLHISRRPPRWSCT